MAPTATPPVQRNATSALALVALGAAALVAVPLLSVLASLASPAREVWAHLWRTQLPELLGQTAALLVGVGVGTLALGTTLAWLVVGYDFPGRRLFEWALVLPLAVPAYVIGFVLLGLLDYAGPVQGAARALLGPDTRLPDPRSGLCVTLAMTLVFYPYVYALARAAFLEQAPEALETARVLGRTRLRAFREVALPLARPALTAGAALACMEALADFGTVTTFGYRTLTEAIYRVWHGMFDRTAATQLAAVLLGVAAIVLAVERASRGRARYAAGRRRPRALEPAPLHGARAAAAAAFCGLVLLAAFGIPVAQLAVWVGGVLARDGLPRGFGALVGTSLGLAGLTAALVTGLAIVLGYAVRLHRSRLVVGAVRLAALGYALPGALVAVGVLLPLAALDRALAGAGQRLLGLEPALWLTGSAAGLLFAYLVRFLAVGAQSVEASLTRIPRSLDDAARSLGAGTRRMLREVHLPLMRRGVLAAGALVFVDVLKEMPATILLRPFGMDTLAIAVWQRTAESLWEEAAVPALAIVLAGLLPVALALRVGSAPGARGAVAPRSAAAAPPVEAEAP